MPFWGFRTHIGWIRAAIMALDIWKGPMGDAEGGSNAAQSAQDPDSKRQRGFLGRIFGAITPSDSHEEQVNGSKSAGQRPVPGLSALGMANLRRMRLDDVAIPTAEIVAVPVDIKKEELVEVFRKSGLTRLPVYDGTLDTPIGLVHLKDFALKHGFNGKGPRFSLKGMVRPLIFAPPSMPIGILLQKMQSERMHMALVIDEYGGVDGLVTIEDLIEQVVGEIEDEHDTAEGAYWTQEKPGVYLVQSKTPLEDFEAEIGMKLAGEDEDEEVDTLGGLVFVLMGRVPARGEVVQHPSGLAIEVVEADPRRIKRLRVRLPGSATK